MEVLEKISPVYTIYSYTDFLYRIVKFKRREEGVRLPSDSVSEEPQERFMQSYCRSRSVVLQCALCNSWDYFVTITVSPEKFNRMDLDVIYKSLSQWFRDYRKQYSNIKYLLVPEHHKDGAWHFHGFLSGVSPSHVTEFVPGIHPWKLVKAGYKNFGLLASHIGFVSLAPVRDPVASAFYVVKYITKEAANDSYYRHLYYRSRGLDTARPVSDIYVPDLSLDEFLNYSNNFCDIGWVKTNDFTFPYSFPGSDIRDEELIFPAMVGVEPELVQLPEYVQLSIAEWCNGNIPD